MATEIEIHVPSAEEIAGKLFEITREQAQGPPTRPEEFHTAGEFVREAILASFRLGVEAGRTIGNAERVRPSNN